MGIRNRDSIPVTIEELGKERPWYQVISMGRFTTIGRSDLRANVRTKAIIRFIPQVLRPTDTVLDIGCSSGLHSLIAGRFCRSVLGIDTDDIFIRQAEYVKSIWGKDTSNVNFKKCDIHENLNLISESDVIFVIKVLYHRDFIEGVHQFMSVIQGSKVRLILAQGHVTQPRYQNIGEMTELFSLYGFKTVVLEDIPEYPIVVAIREGERLDTKIEPRKSIVRNVQYRDIVPMKYNRCIKAIGGMDGKPMFYCYMEVFERCFIETGIISGRLGSINPSPVGRIDGDDTEFAKVIGVNKHSNLRVGMAKEFFDLYEKYGKKEFFKRYVGHTEYYRVFRPSKKRILWNLQMYDNMKVIKNLVPMAKNKGIEYSVYYPEDFPWAINYLGYIKKRDGAHRRMIMAYFGHEEVDTIVVRFGEINKEDLKNTIPYLYENFDWFCDEVKKARGVIDE